MKMGNRNSGKQKYEINKDFFKIWSSDMAYILGFSCADGNVHERTLAWELTDKHISNLKLLKSFNKAMRSNYPIKKRKNSYRLRVSNSYLIEDIKKLGIIPNKKKILKFPHVPKRYLSHFLRGFLDGDGWVVTRIRKNGAKEICAGFSNGSKEFTERLIDSLRIVGLEKFNPRKRVKLTKKGIETYCYQLEFYSNNANKLLEFTHGNLSDEDIRLERKYKKFLDSKKFFIEQEEIKHLGRKNLRIQKKYGEKTAEIIKNLLEESLIPREIAKKLGISLPTLYRWMDKMRIRKSTKRGSTEWSDKVIKSRRLVKK
ncbi:hypothetical protein CMI41_04540 [Candidatus Pacearchaeota archaeon]|nr:hypothetical protein [Candidatus Pacearchaeota archaeon]|tara:strand:- start:10205 stop:11146 length:942 start_codon:yes stop_codon:yes gene_type:complete